ncbi:paraquat-inducible protein A [Salinisphaera hydrothermalis]|uniref:PqiA family integral membrane protein n=1 Tax=Salinisphaera hydrothermalis (strain C41B8) TaxID=1304275 RepID=A0A084IR99_SALHC|nr:paraquat-inducible protein A [Salinisphaera hydrothermalis]KEZ79233.1 PqiA family integral membrane protein [Salinisphaera hydrothermalis C41B8]
MSRLALCRECDWVSRLPPRRPGQQAHCPRCGHHLTGVAQRDAQAPMAWAIAALIALGLVFVFPFLGFSTHGVGHVMNFGDTVSALIGDDYGALAAVLLATTVGFPGVYLAALIYLCIAAGRNRRPLPGVVPLARLLRPLEPWMMSDVFIVGVLVSLIKIVSLADIHIRASFVAFCVYSLLLLRTLTLIDWTALWDAVAPVPAPGRDIRSGATGRSQSLVACAACDTPFVANRHHRCPRCGKRHHVFRVDRIQLTWALLVTSALLYIPANIYPVLSTITLGNAQPQTIAGGVLHLAEAGDWPIAAVIFVASIVVPISKIVALGWLCIAAQGRPGASLSRTRAYRLTEKIGRWSMIDVFVVAVLATLVQAGALMSIEPGRGAVAFAGVVILTMIAALTFDTRLLWPDSAYPDPDTESSA